jgi:hypothetical protein
MGAASLRPAVSGWLCGLHGHGPRPVLPTTTTTRADMRAFAIFAVAALATASPAVWPAAQRLLEPALAANDDIRFPGWYDPRPLGGRMLDVRG